MFRNVKQIRNDGNFVSYHEMDGEQKEIAEDKLGSTYDIRAVNSTRPHMRIVDLTESLDIVILKDKRNRKFSCI